MDEEIVKTEVVEKREFEALKVTVAMHEETIAGMIKLLEEQGERLGYMADGVGDLLEKVGHISAVVDNLSTPGNLSENPGIPKPTLFEVLKNNGLNADALKVMDNGDIYPAIFLGDLWTGYADIIKNFGYKWVSAGRDSHWGKGEASTQTTFTPTTAPIQADPTVMKIGSIVENMKTAKIKGRVTSDVNTKKVSVRGESKDVHDFTVEDETGSAKVSSWSSKPNVAKGQLVVIDGLAVKGFYGGKPQLSFAKGTTVGVVG